MSFGKVLEALKVGQCVARKGWNGKGMHVSVLELYVDKDVKIDNPCLVLYNAQGKYNTWIPSVTDIFAEDWEIISE